MNQGKLGFVIGTTNYDIPVAPLEKRMYLYLNILFLEGNKQQEKL